VKRILIVLWRRNAVIQRWLDRVEGTQHLLSAENYLRCRIPDHEDPEVASHYQAIHIIDAACRVVKHGPNQRRGCQQ
jgi:hypothetical protein